MVLVMKCAVDFEEALYIKRGCLKTVVRLYRDKWNDSPLVFEATSRMLAMRNMLSGDFREGHYLADYPSLDIPSEGRRPHIRIQTPVVTHSWGIGFVVGYADELFRWADPDLSNMPLKDYAFDPFVLDVFYDWIKRPGALERVKVKSMVSLAVMFLASHIYEDTIYMFSKVIDGEFLLEDEYRERKKFVRDGSLLNRPKKDVDALARAVDIKPTRMMVRNFGSSSTDGALFRVFMVASLLFSLVFGLKACMGTVNHGDGLNSVADSVYTGDSSPAMCGSE